MNEPRNELRRDIEGMRAVAVLLVLLFHAGIPLLGGGYVGVDVFFVISGFLITRILIQEVESTGRVSLARFYARRARRLLPAAAVVLVATAVLVRLFIPVFDRTAFAGDIVAAAIYLVNWRLADRQVDYQAEDIGPSPVMHFWSLAVEEQFYVVWPLLLLAVAWWVRRSGWSVRASMAAGLTLVAVPSFAWSIVMTERAPTSAFFVTTTRLWELSVGAALAIAAPRLVRIPARVAAAAGWLGLLAVVLSALLVGPRAAWPGHAALWPTLATAVVLGAGPAAGRAGPVALLGVRPMVWLGGLSYSLYLWHWPLLVIAAAVWGPLSPLEGLGVVAGSAVVAWLSYVAVENPARHARRMSGAPWYAIGVGINLSLVGVAAGVLVLGTVPSRTQQVPLGERVAAGAAVLLAAPAGAPEGEPVDRVAWFVPDPLEAPDDVSQATRDECHVNVDSSEPIRCVHGDTGGDPVIAIVGDSKVLQWHTAIEAIGARRGWKILTFTKSACPFADAEVILRDDAVYDACTAWNRKTLARLLAERPDYVFTSQGKKTALVDGQQVDRTRGVQALAHGLSRRWQQLIDAGIQVIVVRDTPSPGFHVYKCVAEHPDELTRCAYEKDEGELRNGSVAQRAAIARSPGVHWIDLNDAICPGPRCAPIIGNVLIYRQGSHVTATYIATLTPRLEQALAAIID